MTTNTFAPIPCSRFYFEVDGLADKMVKKIDGIEFQGKTAGSNKPLASTKKGRELRQTTSAGYETNPDFTITTYVCKADRGWYDWMLETMPTSYGGKGKWSGNRKSGSLVGYDSEDQEILRWDFSAMWVKSYEVSEFSADSDELATETFTIVCERVNRVK